MKNKGIMITTIIFFLLVNTTYYWKGKLGILAFPAFLILFLLYFGLGIALIRQIYFLIKEKFTYKIRLINIGLLTLVLTLTFLKPFGLLNFDELEGHTILVAEREGAANCMITLKLKENFTFREQSVCFGVTEIKGDFHLQNDTIYFDNVNVDRSENEFYMFAVITPSEFKKDGKHFDLTRYKSFTDTIGNKLWITRNELYKLNKIKPNR